MLTLPLLDTFSVASSRIPADLGSELTVLSHCLVVYPYVVDSSHTMVQNGDVIERTLAVFKDVSAYTIPPRMGSSGVKSGSWRIEDRIFTGRLMVMDCGSVCQLRLADGSTGELFAMCPLRVGERMTCVEPAADSSRNFVIRVVDATSGRHAFLGMGFPERDDAFDFNVALSDWDKHAQGAAPGAAGNVPTAAAPQHDFSLKPGESIKVKPVASRASGGGLLSAVAALNSNSSSSGSGGLLSPPLPSSATSGPVGAGLLPALPAPPGGHVPPPPSAVSLRSDTSTTSNSLASGTSSQEHPAAEVWTAFA